MHLGERGTVRVKCLAQAQNTSPQPGVRFSKLPVITGPVKLFVPFQMEVPKGLKIIQ